MAHCGSIVTISKAIDQGLCHLVGQLGIHPAGIMFDYNKFRRWEGIYARALLKKGLTEEERLALENPPRVQFDTLVLDNLEQVFGVLEIPPSQEKYRKLAKSLARHSCFEVFDCERLRALFDIPVFKSELEKFAEWCQKATVAIQKMEVNSKLLASATREEYEFSQWCYFHWHYNRSDSDIVREHGIADHKRVVEFVNKTLAKKPHLKKVVDVLAEANGLNPEFFTKV